MREREGGREGCVFAGYLFVARKMLQMSRRKYLIEPAGLFVGVGKGVVQPVAVFRGVLLELGEGAGERKSGSGKAAADGLH